MTCSRPNFIIDGAPKCGTTSISYWLSQNPECYFSPVKEPHFFANHYNASNMIDCDQYDAQKYAGFKSEIETIEEICDRDLSHWKK